MCHRLRVRRPEEGCRPVASQATLDIERLEHDGCQTLVLTGELELVTTPKLELAVSGVCACAPRELEIDLRRVSFIDSTGLRGLIVAKETCAQHAVALFLRGAEDARQRRLFEVAGLLDHLAWRQPRVRNAL
jgi:anti-sigma B factor antagonist